ncbi:MAG: hydrolase [Chromatiales bacterium 21-64-14]|nr:MAG: hydrolase [Chromatiales bacterium 21-64-14]HQU15316.1 hydrolase [Gammaproteobacteria bacterium]
MIALEPFIPAWWLPGPHSQTLWPNRLRPRPRVALRWERLELADGDFLDLAWTAAGAGPTVLVLHGLEGCAYSTYALGLLRAIERRGWRAVVMHFRGCSGTPNRLPRSYHSGETGDLQTVVEHLRAREPDVPLAAVGYSLGGNVLLKWLGEQGVDAPLRCAVAVSVPFELAKSAQRLERGFSRVYQWSLVRRLRRSVREKFRTVPSPLDLRGLSNCRTFRAFDDRITAPLHGYTDADDYYRRCSSRPYLARIRIPTLVLQARDDPFLTPDAIPGPTECAASVQLEIQEAGGHVGFVYGPVPWRARYWLEERIPAFLASRLKTPDPR